MVAGACATRDCDICLSSGPVDASELERRAGVAPPLPVSALLIDCLDDTPAGTFPATGSVCDPLAIASEWLVTIAAGRVGCTTPDPMTEKLGMTITTVKAIRTRTFTFANCCFPDVPTEANMFGARIWSYLRCYVCSAFRLASPMSLRPCNSPPSRIALSLSLSVVLT
jgi:hypothetical protein